MGKRRGAGDKISREVVLLIAIIYNTVLLHGFRRSFTEYCKFLITILTNSDIHFVGEPFPECGCPVKLSLLGESPN